MRLLRSAVLLVALLSIVLIATPVYAYEDPPDSDPTIEQIDCYRNILETGDFLILVYENTPYGTAPDTDVDDAFVMRLIDTDGTTELAQSLAYPYNDNGYGYNIYSFYFDADDAPTWEQQYYLRLSGYPVVFGESVLYNFQIETSDYSSLTESTDVKAVLAVRILAIAKDLDRKWGLDSDSSLLLESETGTVLSIYGEAFFRGAVYGIQGLAPAVFRIIVADVTVTPRTWSTSYNATVASQWTGTWVQTARDSGQTLFGVDYDLFGLILALVVCFGALIANIVVAGDTWGGLLDATVPFVVLSRLSFIGLDVLALGAAVAWLYISSRIWGLSRA